MTEQVNDCTGPEYAPIYKALDAIVWPTEDTSPHQPWTHHEQRLINNVLGRTIMRTSENENDYQNLRTRPTPTSTTKPPTALLRHQMTPSLTTHNHVNV